MRSYYYYLGHGKSLNVFDQEENIIELVLSNCFIAKETVFFCLELKYLVTSLQYMMNTYLKKR